MTAQPRGAIREVFSMGKAYAAARQQHGQSALLDEIVTSRPEIDRTRYSSTEELREHCVTHVRDAAALLEAKAAPDERDEYNRFVLTLADKVARAYGEGSPGDDAISSAERSTIGRDRPRPRRRHCLAVGLGSAIGASSEHHSKRGLRWAAKQK